MDRPLIHNKTNFKIRKDNFHLIIVWAFSYLSNTWEHLSIRWKRPVSILTNKNTDVGVIILLIYSINFHWITNFLSYLIVQQNGKENDIWILDLLLLWALLATLPWGLISFLTSVRLKCFYLEHGKLVYMLV